MQNKIDITLYLKYFIFPIISLISLILMYILLILPYINIKSELDTQRDPKNTQIKLYETKLAILQNAREKKDQLNLISQKLNKLVPSDESPAPLVGELDSSSAKFNFQKIDENKNVVESPGYIDVRFNGRTIGPLSAVNFITSLNNNKDRVINLRNIELFDDRENKYFRISFMARTIFNKTKVNSSIDSPVTDILNDPTFKDFMKKYLE